MKIQVLGFQLGRWLNQDQISQGKKADQFEADIRQAIEPQPQNQPQHIHLILLTQRNGRVRFEQQDSQKFRTELSDLIDKTDQQWLKERHWKSPQGYHCREFAGFPTVGKYLADVWFVPRAAGNVKKKRHLPGTPWILFKARGGSYSGKAAMEALRAIISKKASHYDSSSKQRVNLLIHYGADAFNYNTPYLDVDTPDFKSVAKAAAGEVQFCSKTQTLPFEKVYLCNTLPLELDAHEIFPKLLKCR
jgi:hypothetical protein